MLSLNHQVHRIGYGGWKECRRPSCLRGVSESRIRVLQSPQLWHPRACIKAFASSRKLEYGAFRGLHSRNNADPGLDAEACAEGNHFVRNVPEHTMSRILPPSGLPEVRIPRLMAHSRIL